MQLQKPHVIVNFQISVLYDLYIFKAKRPQQISNMNFANLRDEVFFTHTQYITLDFIVMMCLCFYSDSYLYFYDMPKAPIFKPTFPMSMSVVPQTSTCFPLPNTLPLFTHTPQKEAIPLHEAQGQTTQITFFQKDPL